MRYAVIVFTLLSLLLSCEGSQGPIGKTGPTGPPGPPGSGQRYIYSGSMPHGLGSEEFYRIQTPELNVSESPTVVVYAHNPEFGWVQLSVYGEVDSELWAATYYFGDGFVDVFLAGGVEFYIVIVQ